MSGPLPEGFALHRAWAPAMTLADLVDGLAWEQQSVTVFGKTYPTPRLTAWYGEASYTYSGVMHPRAAMPEVLAEVRDRLEHQLSTRERPVAFNSVLANYYRDGRDSVAWHADDEDELGLEPTIASLSVGGSRKFAVKCVSSTCTVPGCAGKYDAVLRHGDLLVMSGRSQLDYLHSVPKTATACGPRVNLTFRWVS